MDVDRKRFIWNENWKNKCHADPRDILYSRSAGEAYHCLKSFLDEHQDRTILEAGCGAGRLCCLLACDFSITNIIGIDTSDHALKTAYHIKDYFHIPNISFETGDIFQISFPDNYFDVVFNEGVIEHFALEDTPNYIDALQEMIRVTKTGGKVIIAVPNWFNLPHTLYKRSLSILGREYKYGYEKSFKHSELVKLFMDLKLKKLEVSGFFVAHGFIGTTGADFIGFFFFWVN